MALRIVSGFARFNVVRVTRLVLCVAVLVVMGPAWAEDAPGVGAILLSDRGIDVTTLDLERELSVLTPAEQATLLADQARLTTLVRRIYRDKRMLAEAEALDLDRSPAVEARLYKARRDLMILALRDHVESQLETPDASALAREQYATRPADFQAPEEFRVSHILLKVTCEAEREPQRTLIESLQARLAAGDDFAELASAHSQDSSAAAGGELPDWVTADALDPAFAEALKALSDGEISGVVESRFGYHLIHRLASRPARMKTFDEVQPELEASILRGYTRTRLAEAEQPYWPSETAQVDTVVLDAFTTTP
ncbi:peptidylprolyl isomerase [Thiocapsa rosea]|uniref:peptidylprolyl isomerase n=1 Tax=Thiocapsa rosea TaxID=69360 RepID=A0A495V7E8_9GAMM|nr:peptidylprolyl isomerase [Thiocapsa rosea]RKT44445.1 peptidyl-prolyl cis-trans isomerase C [Thiocapsa rosea]